MTFTYTLVLSHHDRSGIIQTFGPYEDIEAADAAQAALIQIPAIQAGLWEIVPCWGWTP